MRNLNMAGIILAAGRGTRMKSDLPKVLHSVGGVPMLQRVLEAVEGSGCQRQCIVLSPPLDPFRSLLEKWPDVAVCVQDPVNGTAGAVGAAALWIKGETPPAYARTAQFWRGEKAKPEAVLIVYGDGATLDRQILRDFISFFQSRKTDFALLGMEVANPQGYGRLLRDAHGTLVKIVEEKDTTETEKKVTLCNSGIICAKTDLLFSLLDEVECRNQAGEYYLTDCIGLAVKRGIVVDVMVSQDTSKLLGVNDPQQLLNASAQLTKSVAPKA